MEGTQSVYVEGGKGRDFLSPWTSARGKKVKTDTFRDTSATQNQKQSPYLMLRSCPAYQSYVVATWKPGFGGRCG